MRAPIPPQRPEVYFTAQAAQEFTQQYPGHYAEANTGALNRVMAEVDVYPPLGTPIGLVVRSRAAHHELAYQNPKLADAATNAKYLSNPGHIPVIYTPDSLAGHILCEGEVGPNFDMSAFTESVAHNMQAGFRRRDMIRGIRGMAEGFTGFMGTLIAAQMTSKYTGNMEAAETVGLCGTLASMMWGVYYGAVRGMLGEHRRAKQRKAVANIELLRILPKAGVQPPNGS